MRHRRTLIAVLFLVLPLTALAQEDDLKQRFTQARQKYEEQDFKGSDTTHNTKETKKDKLKKK